jgi:hypothetical protein
MVDALRDGEVERIAPWLKAAGEGRAAGAGFGRGGEGRIAAPDLPEGFPPPPPFGAFVGGATYYSSGEAETWFELHLEDSGPVFDYQYRFSGQAFRIEHHWAVESQPHQITLTEQIIGPGHDSTRSVVFDVS